MNTENENGSLLAVDVGGGTQDILVYKAGESIENCPKLVMPSPTQTVGQKIREATTDGKPVFLYGEVMGGGSCTVAAKEHLAAGLPVFATSRAALTFHDNLERVEKMGITLSETPPDRAVRVRMGDVDIDAIATSIGAFGLRLPRQWAVAVQDHGYSPDASNRLTRFKWYKDFIDAGGRLDGIAFRNVPPLFTRMLAVKHALPEALLMDTGTAAIMGALLDSEVGRRKSEGLVVANAGNCHVMCALILDERMVGLVEHHTGQLNSSNAWDLIERFRRGDLTNEEVLDDGGHGCYVNHDLIDSGSFEFIAVTGPNRQMLGDRATHMAVPYGDMMLTGCFGLVDAAHKLGMISG